MRALIGFGRCQIPSPMVRVVPHQYSLIPFCCINYKLLLGNTCVFEDDGVFTPCHSDMEGTERINVRHLIYQVANCFFRKC